MTDKDLTHAIIGAAIDVHRQLGPGLLEDCYEQCLARELTLRGIGFQRQKALPVVYKDIKLECGYRADLLVEGRVIIELKAVEAISPVHEAILLTYLRFSGCRVGLLINFNVTVLTDGIRRRVFDPPEKRLNIESTEVTEGTEKKQPRSALRNAENG